MRIVYKFQKPLAALLLLIFSCNIFLPTLSYGLTSGPQQPEVSTFQPIAVNDMVDLFSGDFRYNIPLMDVGGYPLNLSYNSGQSLDDEASWVGYGWSLNPGSINRQLRGIPDDFSGKEAEGDFIEKQVAVKPFISKGISNPTLKLKRKGKKFPNFVPPLKVNIGIISNNYTGVSAEIGFNATLGSTSLLGGSTSVNLGLNTNNQEGASLSGKINLPSISKSNWNREFSLGSSVDFAYNATRGLEGFTVLGASFSHAGKAGKSRTSLNGSGTLSFAGESYIPAVEIPQRTKSYNYTLRAGGTAFGLTLAGGISGSYSKQDIASADRTKFYPAFGMMNAFEGKNNGSALMDFNRENDRPYLSKIPYLPVPVINHDLFNVTSQNTSGQYKIVSSSSGIFSDNNQKSKSQKFGFGLELAFGWNFHLGVPDLSYNQVTNRSGKWNDKNDYRTNGDFINTSSVNAAVPETYFKKVGENSLNESTFRSRIGDKEAVAVRLRDDSWAKTFARGTANNKLRSKSGKELTTTIRKDGQDKRNDVLSYLKASEADKYGLDKGIQSYPINNIIIKGCNDGTVTSLPRISAPLGKKPHHISEITLTDQGGTRQVYGIPVYNMRQDEVSFSINSDENARKKGLIRYKALEDSIPTSDNDSRMTSKDYLYKFNKQRLRGYATSYLLTGILSPDYVDMTGNGISDDDAGTAVKFNYTKLGDYKWRTPFFNVDGSPQRVANYSEGWLSDKKDDKASYVYGEREQWYMHSIESKTMLALFVLEDREDGLGVVNSDGALNSSFKLKRLKEIRLYSKADLYKNRNDLTKAIPIKTVHFEYSNELFTDVPNSLAGGKLTLKRVYFTFYKNGQGKLHPYSFNYNVPAFQPYQFRQYDRWGMYKPADSTNRNGLNNSEFPYSTQDRSKADRWAGYWQLQQIELPSGGTININYESDDYAYVQDKRSAVMCFLKGVGGLNQSTGITKSNTFYIELPQAVTDVRELKEKYFENMDQLYFKSFVDLDNKNTNYEFVPGYAKIEKLELENTTTAKVTVSKIDGYNPISKAAWQILQNNLPKLAYSDYDNLDSDEPDFIKAVTSMISAISRISDLVRSFDTRANNKNFASRINLNKSWVRLCSPDMKKIGGGSRVKKITMSDKWSEMTGNANTISSTYGQAYYYTTEKALSSGQVMIISSGVASYEPQVGGDENPFKIPVQYTQKKFLGLDQHYYVEQPVGESYFPAPVVGYSKVVVKNIGADGIEGSAGFTASEFFTAKDFPTRVEATDIQRVQPALRKAFRLFSVKLSDHATVSQGYVIENYHMHGKQKAERIVDKNNQEISALFYQYKTDNKNSTKPTLNNVVPAMNRGGAVGQGVIGVDCDFYTDMNEHSTENFGASGEPSGGLYFLGIFPRPWFYWGGFSPNYDKRLFRSSVAIKTINSFPVLEKVIKVEKGSRIETENILWDGETGDVLLTKTQNEFDDPIYSFKYPAYWVYDGMGPACNNQGLYLTNFSSNNDGVISNYGNSILVPGDELIQVINKTNSEVKKCWIIKATDGSLRTVNEEGVVTAINNKLVKVLRSGRRNLSASSVGTIVSLKNPLVGNKLKVDMLSQVVDASANVYSEEWVLPVKLKCENGCPPGYSLSPQGFCYTAYSSPSLCTNYLLGAASNVVYTSFGSRIFAPGYSLNGSGTVTDSMKTGTFWFNSPSSPSSTIGPLNRCGVWPSSSVTGKWIGFSKKILFPDTKTYYFGVAGDNYVRLKIDGQKILEFEKGVGGTGINGANYDVHFKYWNIYPVNLSAGNHIIEISGKDDASPGAVGCQIYNTTIPTIKSATSESQLNILFTTESLRNIYSNFLDDGSCATCGPGYALNPDDNKCYLMTPVDANINVFNPYKAGILGNWHQQRSYVFDINRLNLTGDASVLASSDIRKSGYYSNFTPYWISNSANFIPNTSNVNFSKWIWSNEVTMFNNKGLETENKDALGRYSAAQTGYLQSLPVAIASNSKLRDIAYDGFEDYDLSLQCQSDTCNIYPGHFNFRKVINGNSIKVDSTFAHTGNYSLKLNTGATLTRTIYPVNDILYNRDGKHQYSLYSNYPMLGFSPSLSGQKYVLSFWIKDNDNTNVNVAMNVSVNGSSILTGTTYKAPVVEGWKLVETVFTLGTGIPTFTLSFSPTTTVYLDDLRIFPYDAQLKSYAYDVNSLRLMAELDENNFATFYEYDDEGILIRVKKETEKGVMTVKESRTGIRKAN